MKCLLILIPEPGAAYRHEHLTRVEVLDVRDWTYERGPIAQGGQAMWHITAAPQQQHLPTLHIENHVDPEAFARLVENNYGDMMPQVRRLRRRRKPK